MSLKSFLFQFAILITFCNAVRGQQVVEDIGHYTQIGLPISALGISLLKGDNQGAWQFTKSFVVETVVIQGMKRIINRKRPNGKNYSFPSGHTAASFTSSTYLYRRYGWEYGIPATILATFVGYSRFGTEEPVHYLSDVAVGAAIGIATSLLFTKPLHKNVTVQVSGSHQMASLYLQIKLK